MRAYEVKYVTVVHVDFDEDGEYPEGLDLEDWLWQQSAADIDKLGYSMMEYELIHEEDE